MLSNFDYRKEAIRRTDEELLARLGYKQEFKREFTPFEVFGIAFRYLRLIVTCPL
jgi:hypothetical protein